MRIFEQKIELAGQKKGAACLTAYIQDTLPEGQKRPAVLILPGGGYQFVSPREGEPVALRLAAEGYQCYVLRYAVAPDVYPTALGEVRASLELIRKNADEWQTDEERLFLMGFSAGGHLALNYTVERKGEDTALRGLILCYPVVSSGSFAHRGSFDNLLADYSGAEAAGLLEKLSLEKNLPSEGMPPVFLWSTWDDASVPIENTLSLASALKARQVSTELHVFCEGVHGLSLANSQTSLGEPALEQPAVAVWIPLLLEWLGRF